MQLSVLCVNLWYWSLAYSGRTPGSIMSDKRRHERDHGGYAYMHSLFAAVVCGIYSQYIMRYGRVTKYHRSAKAQSANTASYAS
jgi:hypothetical protein